MERQDSAVGASVADKQTGDNVLLRRSGEVLDQDAVESNKKQRQITRGKKRQTVSKRTVLAPELRSNDMPAANRRSDEGAASVEDFEKEHRRDSNEGSYASAAERARSTLRLATNNALQGTTIATYLTQLWLQNIMQTVGFTALGLFFSSSTARSFPSSSFINGDSETEGLDFKSIVSMIRGFADFAENIHDE